MKLSEDLCVPIEARMSMLVRSRFGEGGGGAAKKASQSSVVVGRIDIGVDGATAI